MYIITDPNFDFLEGHLLFVVHALYFLWSSSARWHYKLAQNLRNEVFNPCHAKTDIRMHPKGNLYEYNAVCIDNLAFVLIKLENFVNVGRLSITSNSKKQVFLNFS